MKITRLEHAGFIVEAGGRRLIVDPGDFTSTATIAGLGKIDGVAISHGHGDHFSRDNVMVAAAPVVAPADVATLLPKSLMSGILRLGETLALAGFDITPVLADHGPKLSRAIENYGLVIARTGIRVYYVGDAARPSPAPSGPFDLVLISIDGTGFVFDAEQASAFVAALDHHDRVVPIHDGAGDEPHHARRFAALASGFCEPVLIDAGESIEVVR
jgi:L-ascorbate metabolism protein UlaG (beta-lactamase superfamily)